MQAPSVYSNKDHWTARGSIEQELVLQGPLQMGFYGYSDTPYIIGSHCTYRMSAIREIGGFQPTRAEDHLDTVVLANKGYKGVFLPEIIAEGDGPETLSVYLAQQFAWAYSMFQVLTGHTLKHIKELSKNQKLQFLFSQTWYPLWALSYLILFIAPLLALLHQREVVTIGEFDMLIHFLPTFVVAFLIWVAARPLMQPKGVWITWRGMILHAVRWPIILRATVSALFKIKKPYMITPKGKYAHTAPHLKTYQPFLALGFLSITVALYALFVTATTPPIVQVMFALANAGFMLSICAVDLGVRFQQRRPNKQEFTAYWLKPFTATATLALFLLSTTGVAAYRSTNYAPIQNEASLVATANPNSGPIHYGMSTAYLIERITQADTTQAPTPDIGVYIPESDGAHLQPYKQHISHHFVDWRDTHTLAYAVAKSLEHNNTPLLTIEPKGEEDGARLLGDITAGHYDDRIAAMKEVIDASPQPIYIRFAHEMDLGLLYPWGAQQSDQYIAAYRYVVDKIRQDNHMVRLVWSPAGNYGANLYYPGDAYVDVIGTTILQDQYWYGTYTPTFYELSLPREWLLYYYNKPVWIVEFGAGAANAQQQAHIIEEALQTYKSRGYAALIYINAKDANLKMPDYRLPEGVDFAGIFTKPAEAPAIEPPKQEPAPQEPPAAPSDTACQPTPLEAATTFQLQPMGSMTPRPCIDKANATSSVQSNI